VIDAKLREWIDGATYEELLRRWRFAPAGADAIFQGETGDYYSNAMDLKRAQLGPGEHAATSKRVGW
jgi:hypothetical protein